MNPVIFRVYAVTKMPAHGTQVRVILNVVVMLCLLTEGQYPMLALLQPDK